MIIDTRYLLTPSEAAAKANLELSSIYKAVTSGKVAPTYIKGYLFIKTKDFNAWRKRVDEKYFKHVRI